VVNYLEEKFYTVKVNAETKTPILWQGKTFAFNSAYKTNEFALYLTQGRLSYPTTVIIPSDGIPQAIPGYLSPKDIEVILKYFGEEQYGKLAFEEFQKNYKSSW
jgi:thioredoxin-related protein